MNKPIAMIIKETKTKIADACNESGLPPVILDLIMQGIYSEIHFLSEKQTLEEEKSYTQTIRAEDIESKNDISKE